MKKNKINLLIIFSVLIFGCTSEKQKLINTISLKEKELIADSLQAIDRKKAKEMIDLYKQFGEKYQTDSNANEFIFKAADIANGIGEYREAIAMYKQVSTQENFRKKAVALFLQGFIFENQLKDYFQARSIYEDFLKRYPDHALADDVNYSLQNLGKTPEELIKEFENNLGKNDSLAAK